MLMTSPLHPTLRWRLAALAAASLTTLAALPVAVQAQSMGGTTALRSNSGLTTLDPYPPEQGWVGLSRVLDHLRPGVDTRLTPSPSQITDHIEAMINRGDLDGALALIEQREAQRKGKPGTDVQLMFQRGRVLAALGRTDEAIAVYTDMTTRFPELPEPWNNRAVLQAGQGKLDEARYSLQMALRADANYTEARANLKQLASRDQAADQDRTKETLPQ
jgi:tetratricopeptide (TPR) repeat protein